MMIDYQERDAQILQRKKGGSSYAGVAREFGISLERVRQIVRRRELEDERLHRSEKYRETLRLSNDIHKKWPKDFLSDSLLLEGGARWSMQRFFENRDLAEASLKDLMDFLIADTIASPHDMYEAMPAYRQKNIGSKTYCALVNHFSGLDLGPAFNGEWDRRLKNLMRHLVATGQYIPIQLRRYL